MSPAAKIWGAEVRRYRRPSRSPGDRSRRPPQLRFSPAVSATQPTATTASVASALSRTPSWRKIIRTPDGVFSNDSIAPKFS